MLPARGEVAFVSSGADYEGRTGLGTFIYGSPMSYDANGNLTADEPRNILRIRYNRQNQPTEVTFGEGHRQTITYDGFGRKIRVDYSQVPDAMIVGHQSIYTDDWYQLTSTREYVGPHVFCDGKLEYSAFRTLRRDSGANPSGCDCLYRCFFCFDKQPISGH